MEEAKLKEGEGGETLSPEVIKKLQDVGKKFTDNKLQATVLLLSGMPPVEVAKELGVTPQYVRQIRRDLIRVFGIPVDEIGDKVRSGEINFEDVRVLVDPDYYAERLKERMKKPKLENAADAETESLKRKALIIAGKSLRSREEPPMSREWIDWMKELMREMHKMQMQTIAFMTMMQNYANVYKAFNPSGDNKPSGLKDALELAKSIMGRDSAKEWLEFRSEINDLKRDIRDMMEKITEVSKASRQEYSSPTADAVKVMGEKLVELTGKLAELNQKVMQSNVPKEAKGEMMGIIKSFSDLYSKVVEHVGKDRDFWREVVLNQPNLLDSFLELFGKLKEAGLIASTPEIVARLQEKRLELEKLKEEHNHEREMIKLQSDKEAKKLETLTKAIINPLKPEIGKVLQGIMGRVARRVTQEAGKPTSEGG